VWFAWVRQIVARHCVTFRANTKFDRVIDYLLMFGVSGGGVIGKHVAIGKPVGRPLVPLAACCIDCIAQYGVYSGESGSDWDGNTSDTSGHLGVVESVAGSGKSG
jgi:hypothetical protein